MAEEVKTVLVVDDDPDTMTYLTTVLEDNGFATVSAKNGAEALQMIGEAPPDLVTLDIAMPEKSGVAVYRALKESEQLKHIPVIITTGISEEFEKFISSRRKVPPPDAYLAKPVESEELVTTVKKLLA
jgi:CheY-like chemotaxis protein